MADMILEPLSELTEYMAKGIAPKYTEEDSENAIYVLNQKCNRDYKISYETVRLHDLRKKKVPEERYVQKYDVLINSTGTGTAGRVAQMMEVADPTTVDGHMIILRNNEKIDPLYYGYAVKSHQPEIEGLAEGSTGQTEINKKRLMDEIIISYPKDLDEQRKISTFLYEIDQKIELNNDVNKNLESQAKALYDKMIIQDMDDSWISGVLSDIATITMGQSPKGDTYNEEANGTVFFQGRAEFRFRFPTQRLYTTDPKRMSQRNDALMSVRAPVGDLNVAYEECCIGRGLAAIHSKDNHQSYVLYTMFALREQLNIFNGEGTVFGSINRDALNSMPIMIPPVSVIDAFEELVAPLDNMIRNNYDEICRLTSIRDSILPKLMSGELDISDIDL